MNNTNQIENIDIDISYIKDIRDIDDDENIENKESNIDLPFFFNVEESRYYSIVNKYFQTCSLDNIDKMINIIEGKSNISLRLLDWIVNNSSKCIINNDIFNIKINYQSMLEEYEKKYFDAFRRYKKFNYKFDVNEKSIVTTLGQLNFFRWIFINDILNYIEKNLECIKEEMNSINKKEIDVNIDINNDSTNKEEIITVDNDQIFRMIFLADMNDKLCEIIKEKNIKIYCGEVPNQYLKNIIDNDNDKKFENLMNCIVDPENLEKIQFENLSLSVYMLKNYLWKVINKYIKYVNWDFKNTNNQLDKWTNNITFAHIAFWHHNIDVITYIINYKQYLLYEFSEKGLTPFDYLLIKLGLSTTIDINKYEKIIKMLNKQILLNLLKNKTTKKYINKTFFIPEGSTFIDILELILDFVSTEINKNKIKILITTILEIIV